MNTLWKLVFFILLTWKVAQSLGSNSTPYDLTNVLNKAVVQLLNSVENLVSLIIMKNYKPYDGTYKINNTRRLRPFDNTIDIIYLSAIGNNDRYLTCPYTIRWQFSENKLHMFYDELKYAISGVLKAGESYLYRDYHKIFSTPDLRYQNISITATKTSMIQQDDEKITIDISYDHLRNFKGIELEKYCTLSYTEHLKLIYIFGLEIPSMMSYFLNIGRLNVLLGNIFEMNPTQHIISAYPDVLANEEPYYYIIPDIQFPIMNFKNITIRGLSNFEAYVNRFDERYSRNIGTLLVKNVRGNMTLDTGVKHLPNFQLSFRIHNFYIFLDPETQNQFTKYICVEAQEYSIVEDTPKPPTLISSWLSEYSASIMKVIQFAVEDALTPSKKDVVFNQFKQFTNAPELSENLKSVLIPDATKIPRFVGDKLHQWTDCTKRHRPQLNTKAVSISNNQTITENAVNVAPKQVGETIVETNPEGQESAEKTAESSEQLE